MILPIYSDVFFVIIDLHSVESKCLTCPPQIEVFSFAVRFDYQKPKAAEGSEDYILNFFPSDGLKT